MKKIIEVVEYADQDIRFKTDLDVARNPQLVLDLLPKLMFSMSSTLLGHNEINIFAVIRALIAADLAISVNRKEMIKMLDEQTKILSKSFREAIEAMQKQGKAVTVPVGAAASKMTR